MYCIVTSINIYREREGGANIEAETAHTVDTGNPFLPVSVSELEAKVRR